MRGQPRLHGPPRASGLWAVAAGVVVGANLLVSFLGSLALPDAAAELREGHPAQEHPPEQVVQPWQLLRGAGEGPIDVDADEPPAAAGHAVPTGGPDRAAGIRRPAGQLATDEEADAVLDPADAAAEPAAIADDPGEDDDASDDASDDAPDDASDDASDDEWVWPAAGEVTSEFGQRWGRMHEGLDVANSVGTPVVAVTEGEVGFAEAKGGYGLTVKIDHGDGLETAYSHLSDIAVADGETLVAGDRLGAMGCSGSCTGPHVHFEVRRDDAPVNPRSLLP